MKSPSTSEQPDTAALERQTRRAQLRARVRRTARTFILLVLILLAVLALAYILIARANARRFAELAESVREQGLTLQQDEMLTEDEVPPDSAPGLLLRAIPVAEDFDSGPFLEILEPSPDKLRRAREALESESDILAYLHRAADAPSAPYPRAADTKTSSAFDFAMAKRLRAAVGVLGAEAVVLHTDGREEAALATITDALKLASTVSEQPSLLAQQLHGHLVRLILAYVSAAHQTTPWAEQELRALYAALAEGVRSSGGKQAIRGEITLLLARADDAGGFFTRSYATGLHLGYLEHLQKMSTLLDEPWRGWPAGEREEARGLWWAPGQTITAIMRPLLQTYAWGRDASNAQVHGLRLSLALEVYRNTYQEYPEALAQLNRLGLAGKLPPDPFSGVPFRYTRTEQGYRFYSVGPDLDDDQGRPPKSGKKLVDGGDMVWTEGSWLPLRD